MLTGDDLLKTLATLANPHRLRIIATLLGGRFYVSELARQLGISRPLLQVHLRRLEAVGLVAATVEVSPEGKAMKYYEVTPFTIHLDPTAVATAVRTLTMRTAEADEPTNDESTGRSRSKGAS
ncbi:ArsR/SmtB family transcription factor [Plantactinospora sp. CA-294935]|uniref:ArsR/SmtB family transcription factor n=1 Tax=Plantactinospora sp. CA-294935 TaxID=3240012 RepID=UPI003D901DA7